MTKLAIFICVFFFGFRCLAQLQKPPKTYAVIIGTKEMEQKTCMVKDLKTGEQNEIPYNTLTAFLTDK